MGYINHQAIIVTTYREDYINEAYSKAKELFDYEISSIMQAPVNDCFTFVIPPDGSKEGWDESDQYDLKRKEFYKWIKTQRFSDGSNKFQCIEISYDDMYEIAIKDKH